MPTSLKFFLELPTIRSDFRQKLTYRMLTEVASSSSSSSPLLLLLLLLLLVVVVVVVVEEAGDEEFEKKKNNGLFAGLGKCRDGVSDKYKYTLIKLYTYNFIRTQVRFFLSFFFPSQDRSIDAPIIITTPPSPASLLFFPPAA